MIRINLQSHCTVPFLYDHATQRLHQHDVMIKHPVVIRWPDLPYRLEYRHSDDTLWPDQPAKNRLLLLLIRVVSNKVFNVSLKTLPDLQVYHQMRDRCPRSRYYSWPGSTFLLWIHIEITMVTASNPAPKREVNQVLFFLTACDVTCINRWD